MRGLVFKPAVFKILTLFSLQPGRKFMREEIKKHTKLNNVPLDSALKLLLAAEILEKEGRKYRLNIEKVKNILEVVRREHLRFNEIPLKAYFPVLDIAERLAKEKCDVYLFGSYAKGNFTADSDVDIAVICEEEIDLRFVKKLEKKYEIKIQIHRFGREFCKHKRDPFVREVLDGIPIIKRL